MPPRPTLGFRVVATLIVGLVRLLGWRVEVQGAEHAPRDGPAVLVYNHHSYADFVMVAWHVFRELDRPLRFLAKQELFDSPWTRWLVRAVQAVPVVRQQGAGRNRALDAGVQALREGHLVVVAPEQTISRSFEPLPFRTGAVRMAQAAGVPIVPVVGWGSHRFATKGQRIRWVRRLPVVVRYEPPIDVPADADPREVTAQLEAAVRTSLHEIQERYPDRPAPDEDPWWLPARLGGSAPTHDEVLAEHEERLQGWVEHPEDPEAGSHRRAS